MLDDPFHVGVTGTREGMTKEQEEGFRTTWRALRNLYPALVFHHGDCVGVDAEAHDKVLRRKRDTDQIVIHPPIDEAHRAFCSGADWIQEPLTHFARNRKIVDSCKVMIVVPLQAEHQSYGGTWYTHDYAKKRARTIYLIKPDGSIV